MCPNYKNKEVFDGFNEIVEALGGRPLTEEEFGDSTLRNQRTGSDYSAMEAAYKLYHRNNGYFLDKTPNGETSILFLTLLDELGDKKEAIKAKSRVYSDSFKNWFGDWINDGLPELSFMPKKHWSIGHIIDTPTEAANICDNTQIKVLNSIINKVGKSSKRGTYYAKPVTIWAKSPINDMQTHHSVVAVRINGEVYLYDMPQSEYIEQIGYNKGRVISEYKPRLIKYNEENLKSLYGTAEKYVHINDESILDEDLLELPTNASKVVDENGEPLVVYHGSKISNEIRIFYNRPTYFADKFTAFSYTPFTNVEDVTKYVYPTFLNIRKPKQVDGKGTYWNNINGMTTDDIVKSVNEEDGVIIRNIKDYSDFAPGNPDLSLNLLEEATLHTDYVTTNPNQIKSAISNVGGMTTPGFSRTYNNIYKSIIKVEPRIQDRAIIIGLHRSLDSVVNKVNGKLNYIQKLLLLIAISIGVRIKFENPIDKKTAGQYNPSDNTITLYLDWHHPNFKHALFHEITHAVFEGILNASDAKLSSTQLKAKRILSTIFDLYKSNSKLSEQYGFKDMHEFVSELVSNDEFVSILRLARSNIWNKIREFFKTLFSGIKLSEYDLDNVIQGLLSDDIRMFTFSGNVDIDNQKYIESEIRTYISNARYNNGDRFGYDRNTGHGYIYINDSLYSFTYHQSGNIGIHDVVPANSIEAVGIKSALSGYKLMIGERGALNLDATDEATHRIDNLLVAKQMHKENKTPLEIKIATGWELGPDGKWRYEIDDFRLSNKLHNIINDKSWYEEYPKELKIKDIIYSKDLEILQKLYPELLEFDVKLTKDPRNGGRAAINTKRKQILISVAYDDEIIRRSFVHELLHFVLNVEGFAEGGSPAIFARNRVNELYERDVEKAKATNSLSRNSNKPIVDKIKKLLDEYKEEGRKSLSFADAIQTYQDYSRNPKEFPYSDLRLFPATDVLKQLASRINTLKQQLLKEVRVYREDINVSDEDKNKYLRLAGEVEARTAANRFGMSSEERRASLFTEEMYQDVAKEDLIFLQNALGQEYAESVTTTSISADEEYIAQTLADDTYYQALVHEEKLLYINDHPELDKDEAAKQFDLNKLKECAHQVTSELATEFEVKPYEVRDNDTEITKIRRSIVEFVYECISNPERVRLGILFTKNAILSPNDITTNVVAIAKEYISKFYSSDAILTALKELDPSGKQNQEVLINTLAKIVTEDIVQDDKYGNLKRGFWSNLVGSIRKGAKVSYETRKKLFDSIAKAMAYQEDLERTSDNLLHELNYQFEDDKHSNIIKTVNALKRGIKNRIAALQSVSASDVDKLKLLALLTQYDKLLALNLDKNDEVLLIFSQFISDGLTELREASRLLASMEYGNPDDIDGTKLRQIRTDVLGYYKNLIRTSIIPMTRKTEYAELQPGGALYNQMGNIIDQCNRLESKYDYILSVYVNTIADDWVDNNVDIGDKRQFKRNLKLWLNNKINRGDLGFFENWIKSASASHSIVVRMIDDYIRKADTSVRIASIAKGKELYKSYLKFESTLSRFFNPVNKFRSLCEVDNEGFNTGNFVTAVNVGQHEYEEKVLKEELLKELNITIDEEGNLVGDYLNIKEYKDQLDMFYDGYDRKTGTYGKVRKHRPYHAIYYIKRRNMLSEDTMLVIDMLNTDIAALRSKCYDEETGAHITADLHADKAKLDELLRLKLELSSPFKIQYDATGKIIGFTPKSGDELRMANEIRAFNKWLSDVRGFKPNLERYKEVEAKVKAKYGADSIQYKQFVYENTATEISDKYYQEIANLFEKKSMSEDVEILVAERNAIRKAITPKRGYYDPDLSLLTDKAYEKIKEIDEAIDEKREKSTPKGRNSDEKKKSIKDYLDMQTTEFIVDPVSGIPYIDKLRNEYSAAGKMGEFLYKFYYENKKGELVPLSIFMKTKPNAEYIISDQPAGDFSDMTGIVDDKYNPEDEFLNIDRERYHNDKYDEIMKDPASKLMYEKLLSTMEEAWSMIPSINRHYKYQLPQQRDDISSLIIRHKSRNRTSWLKTIGRMCAISAVTATSLGIATVAATWSLSLFPGAAIVGGLLGAVLGITANNNSIWEELTSITERDTSYNENFSVRPDGTEVETIPIRWTKRLADPSAVSTDLLKTVTLFYEMALNYKTKLDLVDKLEDIEYMVHGGFTGTQTTGLETRIKQLLSTYLYGRKKTGISKANSTKMSNFEKKFSKLAALLMSMTHAKLLPWNLTSITKNLVDSMCSFIVFIGESFVHPIDMVQAIADMGSEIFTGSAFTNITNVDSRSFTAAAMLYNGVAESVGEMFEERAVNPLRRLVTRHYSMGPFTFIDYTFKGLFTRMVYNTYRLVTDPNTGQQVFANKEEVKDMYRRCAAVGNDAKLGYKAWKNSDVKLKDAYAVDASTSEFIIKPEFKHLISNKLENRVSNLIKLKTSIINGMLDEADKNKLSTNFLGALMLQMRGWMVSKMVDWTKDGRDFAIYSEDDDLKHTVLGSSGLYQLLSRYLGNFTALIVQNEDENYRGIYNPATGYIERGWWKGWSRLASNTCNNLKMYVRGIKPNQMYTTQEVRQIRHLALVLITLLAIAFSSYPITKWFERTYKNDKVSKTEQKTAAFAYTATTAAYSERLSEVGPLGFISIALEIVNSPFISNTYLKDINTVVDATNDLIVIINDEVQGKNWKTEELNSDVKRGSFTGLKKYLRNLLKASAQLPGINLFGIANLYKSSEVAPLLEKEKFYRSTIPEWAPLTAKAHISNTVQDKTTVERIMQAITGDKDKPVKSKSKGNTKKSTRRVY